MEDKRFENRIREKLDGVKVTPPDSLWDSIASELNKKERPVVKSPRKRVFTISTIAAAATLAITIFTTHSIDREDITTKNEEVATNIIEKNQDILKREESKTIEDNSSNTSLRVESRATDKSRVPTEIKDQPEIIDSENQSLVSSELNPPTLNRQLNIDNSSISGERSSTTSTYPKGENSSRSEVKVTSDSRVSASSKSSSTTDKKYTVEDIDRVIMEQNLLLLGKNSNYRSTALNSKNGRSRDRREGKERVLSGKDSGKKSEKRGVKSLNIESGQTVNSNTFAFNSSDSNGDYFSGPEDNIQTPTNAIVANMQRTSEYVTCGTELNSIKYRLEQSTSVGIMADIPLETKLFLNLGIKYLGLDIIKTVNGEYADINSVGYIEIPILAKYYIIDRAVSLYATAGVSPAVALSSDYADQQDVRRVNASSIISMGTSYNFNSGLYIGLEPGYRYMLAEPNSNIDSKRSIFNLSVALGYRFM